MKNKFISRKWLASHLIVLALIFAAAYAAAQTGASRISLDTPATLPVDM